MKKLYLLLLVFLLLFIPATNAVTPYQLDHPIRELNGYTLREVFENRNQAMPDLTGKTEISVGVYRIYTNGVAYYDYNTVTGLNTIYSNTGSGTAYRFQLPQDTYTITVESNNTNQTFYLRANSSNIFYLNHVSGGQKLSYTINNLTDIYIIRYDTNAITSFTLQIEEGSTSTPYQVPTDGPYSDIDVGEFNLTTEQMEMYYDYYLEAVQFEIDYYEAGLDPGEYQHIFKSILNGVKNLISEMGYVWQWLNAPIITSDMQDYSFNIDWSWDLIGVIRQIMNSAGILTLQIAFWVPSLAFAFMGIPIQISVLSLLFSNLIFLLLGWILVKSLLI